MKLCINCQHFLLPKSTKPEYGKCAHPENVIFRLDCSPVTGDPYDEPDITFKIDFASTCRKHGDCKIEGVLYEANSLCTMMTNASAPWNDPNVQSSQGL